MLDILHKLSASSAKFPRNRHILQIVVLLVIG